jgi:hypothetical protein
MSTTRGLVVVVLGFVLLRCGKVAETPGDAGETDGARDDAAASEDAGGTGDASLDTGTSSDVGTDSTVDAAPPNVSCTADAGVCNDLPPSVCGDSKTLLYFSDGACVGGKCTWKQTAMTCGPQSSCFQGGCTPPTTK